MPAGRPSEYNKMIIETKKISDLKPAPYNPRQSTAKQEEKLKASLSKFGLVEPIIFNKQTGYIVGGHFRVRELNKLGYEEIECVIVDLNEADEKELNIRLNANTGQWDWEMLANEWNSDELTEWGLDVPNFDNEPQSFENEDTSSTSQLDYLKFGNYQIPLTTVEIEKLSKLVDDYIEENTVTSGFILKLLE
jgi:hypothetical protein